MIEHLSYSRISRYEQCPRSYHLKYLEKIDPAPNVSLAFGKVIHSVLEKAAISAAQTPKAAFDIDLAISTYKNLFSRYGLSGSQLFNEGLEIIRKTIDAENAASPNILAIEKEFSFRAGKFDVIGFIDRVDKIDESTINIIDYKTNRALFSRPEVDNSLQMSIYQLAAAELWPWATNVELTFHMLRHGIKIKTNRSKHVLDIERAYIEAVGNSIEISEEFPAVLNQNCLFCDYRTKCDDYQDVIKLSPNTVSPNSTNTISEIAAERDRVAVIAKILAERKSELDKLIKAHIEKHGNFTVGNIEYSLKHAKTVKYPPVEAIEVAYSATSHSMYFQDIIDAICDVSNTKLKAFIKDQGDTCAMRSALSEIAEVSWQTRLAKTKKRISE